MHFRFVAFLVFTVSCLLGTARAQYYGPYSAATATYLIGGIGFEQLPYEAFAYDINGALLGSVGNLYSDTTLKGDRLASVLDGPYAQRVTLYWDGTNLASSWDGEASLLPAGSVGGYPNVSGVGDEITTSRRLAVGSDTVAGKNFGTETDESAGLYGGNGIAFRVKEVNPGMTVALKVDATGYNVTALKFTAFSLGTDVTLTWFYSLNGSTLVPTGFTTTVSGATAVAKTVDLSSIAALSGANTVWLVARLTATATPVLVLDSIQVIGKAPGGSTAPGIDGTPPAGVTGTAYSFTFTVIGNPAPTLSVTSGALPPGLFFNGFVLGGTPTTTGGYTFTVQADNGIGSPATLTRSIVVAAPPGPPSITTAASTSFVRGTAGTFTVAASANPAAAFTLESAPAWLSINSVSGVLSGTPPSDAPASVSFTIRAANGVAPDATQSFTLTINSPPTFSAPSYAATFVVGQAGTTTVSATGTPTPTYSLGSGAPAWLSINPTTGVLSGTPTGTAGSPHTITVQSASSSGQASVQLVLTVESTPQAPAIVSANAATFTMGTAGSFTVTASGYPASVFSVAGAPAWLSIGAASGVLAGTPPAGSPAVVSFHIVAANGVSPDATQAFSLAIVSAPAITSAAVATFVAQQAGTFTVSATGSPAPTFALTGAPAWLTIGASTGVLAGTPPAGLTGTVSFTVRAANGISPDFAQSFVLSIASPPAITSLNTATFTAGAAGTFTVTGTGAPPPTFALSGAPAWLALDAATGVLSGTPPADAPASISFTLRAANGVAPDATQSFTLVVNKPPVFTATSFAATFVAGQAGSTTVSATSNPAPTYSLGSGAPEWLSINPLTGVVSGTPPGTSGSSHTVTVQAANPAGQASVQLALTVQPAQQAPAVTSTAAATFTVGAAGSFTVTATGYPDVTFTLTGAPAWLSIGAASGVLSGTPPVAGPALVTFSVVATNGVSPAATQAFTLTIASPPAITSAATASFVVQQASAFTVIATGNPAPTFSLSGAPAWLSINATTGMLAGTPPANSAGTATFTLRAANGVSPESTQSFSLVVVAPPTITSANTTTFTAGSAGTFTVTASGTPAPTFSITGAPAWLSINAATGVLAGTPPVSDGPYVFTFSVTAQNGASPNAAQAFTLVVQQLPAITSGNAATFTPGVAGSFTVAATGNPAPAFSLGAGRPAWLTIDVATGVMSGTPPDTTGSPFVFPVVATNPAGAPQQSFTLTVSAAQRAPEITSQGETTFVAGQAGSFTVTASGNPAPTFALVGAPSWLSIGAASGTLTGTPPADAAAVVSFTVRATNGISPDAAQTFELTVSVPPNITSAATATFVRGQAGSHTVTALGRPAPIFSLPGIVSSLSWLSIDPVSGVLAGTPPTDAPAMISFTIRADNGVGAAANQTFELRTSDRLGLTSASTATFVVGEPGAFAVVASGAPAPIFSLRSAPAWLAIGASTGELAGTPPADSPPSLAFEILARNGVSPDVTQAFTLTVQMKPAITSVATTSFQLEKAGSFVAVATGRPAPVFSLSGAPAWLTIEAATGVLAGTPPAGTTSPTTFAIIATNQAGSARQDFTLTFSSANRPPAIVSAAGATFVTGELGSFTVRATGNPAPVFILSGAPSWVSIDSATGVLSGIPPTNPAATTTFTIRAANGLSPDASQTFELVVKQSPIITSAAMATFVRGLPGSHTVTASGRPAPVFSLSGIGASLSWLSIEPGTGVLAGTPPPDAPATASFTVRADNGVGVAASQTFELRVNDQLGLTSAAAATFVVGERGTFAVVASGTPEPAFSLRNAPSWLTISGTGVLSGTPPAGSPASVAFDILASNGVSPDVSQAFTLTIQVKPAITSAATASFQLERAGSFTVAATGRPTPVFSLSGAPAWLAIGTTSGVLAGTPPAGTASPVAFAVVATNAAGSTRQDFKLTLTAATKAPAIVSAAATTFAIGEAGVFSVRATGNPAPAYLISGAPSWVSIDSASGILSGTPPADARATSIFTIRAVNGISPDATQTFTLSATLQVTLAITSASSTTFEVGQSGTFFVSATGQPAPVFGLVGAPDWLSINAVSGVLTGTPPSDAPATVTFTIRAANGADSAVTQSFRLTVQPSGGGGPTPNPDPGQPGGGTIAPQFTSATTATFTAGQSGSFTVTAKGNPTPTLSLSGNPAWLAFDPTSGLLSGVPPADSPSSLVVSLIAANGVQPNAIQTFVLNVTSAPRFTNTDSATFIAGKSGRFTVHVAGSPAPTIQVASNPAWLAFEPATGVLSGTPPADAPSSIILTLTAANGLAPDASQTFVLHVITPPKLTEQPKARIAAAGGSVRFAVAAVVSGTTTYQWLRDGAPIVGATTEQLVVTNVQPTDAQAAFACRVSNEADAVNSAPGRVMVLGSASRRIALTGGTFSLDIYSAPALADWTVSSETDWLTANRTSADAVQFVAPAFPVGTRSGELIFSLPDGTSETFTVVQEEAVLVAEKFPVTFDPLDTSSPWMVDGSTVPSVLLEFEGHESVISLFPETTAGSTNLSAADIHTAHSTGSDEKKSAAATAVTAAAIYGRHPLSASAGLRVESDMLLKIGALASGGTEASVGLIQGGQSPGSGEADGVQFTLVQEPSGAAEPLSGGAWLKARYRDEANRVVSLDRALGVPLANADGRWLRLRVDISADRQISFWADPEPFGDPVRIWAPVPKASPTLLEGERVVARLQSADLSNRPYVSRLRVATDYFPIVAASRLVNISARVSVGADVGIVGFVPQGGQVRVLVRGIGPALRSFGVTSTLATPRMVAYDGSSPPFILRIQDAWERQRDPLTVAEIREASAQVGAFPLAAGAADSAWIYTPNPATALRTIMLKSAVADGEGEALLELYEMPGYQEGRLVNLSARSFVPGGRSAIAGFVFAGNASKLFLVRAVGPGLRAQGVTNAIERTTLSFYRESAELKHNQGWTVAATQDRTRRAAESAGAFALQAGSGDSAILVRLPPGLYTAPFAAVPAGQAGTGLLEVYEVPDDTLDTLATP